jgi:hypothetical protein
MVGLLYGAPRIGGKREPDGWGERPTSREDGPLALHLYTSYKPLIFHELLSWHLPCSIWKAKGDPILGTPSGPK